MRAYDVFGNIALLKFRKTEKLVDKKKQALKLLRSNPSVRTVLEKSDKFKGRLRTLKTNYLAGEKTKESLYRENGCIFRFNVEKSYFSPRLSNERLEIAKLVKRDESVLVLFGGVAPFAITIAKIAMPKRVISVELGRESHKYAVENVKRNKANVELIQGNVRRVLPKLKEKFDRIIMARPNLKDSFLDVVFPRIKKSGIIHYYGFYNEDEKEELKELIFSESKKAGKKIKILRTKKPGDIGPYKFRYRVDFKVLN